ncbi:MAG TPA: aspartyl protease family protein [Candidatus Babeliales bacterium]|nr:aspartyl protease family protein [Candidatus Babeliales bacterium]
MTIKKYITTLPVILLSQITFAQPTQTSIPLQFDFGNPAPYGGPSTVITIQGKKLPILLDTGAKKSEVTLSPYALKNLNVKFTGKYECFNAVDGRYCEKVFIIPEINIGSFVLKNVKGTMMSKLWGGNDEDLKENEASKNGVIGFSLLSKFNLLLDYPNSKAILVKRGESPINYDVSKWISIPFTDHLNTHLYINGELRTISWDTGAIPSVIRKSSNDKLSSCPGDAPYSKKKDCISIKAMQFATVNNIRLPNTWFKVIKLPSYAQFDGLIGSNFYSENLVYFDFDKNLIFVRNVSSNK